MLPFPLLTQSHTEEVRTIGTVKSTESIIRFRNTVFPIDRFLHVVDLIYGLYDQNFAIICNVARKKEGW